MTDQTVSEQAENMVWIEGGSFMMGSQMQGYAEEWPAHTVYVDGFYIDPAPVTVAQFASFVEATNYRTVAERPLNPADYPRIDPRLLIPGSLVFTPTAGPVDLGDWRRWWKFVPGASWRFPEGPGSSIADRYDHPVTHVAWEDATAFALWSKKQLPTEAEWEFASRGGLVGALFVWGDERAPDGQELAHHWTGDFPWRNSKPAHLHRTAPVKTYPANGYGLFDMAGNVWEWTQDFYRSDHSGSVKSCCGPSSNPRIDEPLGSYDAQEPGGAHVPRRVIKGGSYLCADSYCLRYRPAARQGQQLESSMSHIGFRCIVRPEEAENILPDTECPMPRTTERNTCG